MKSNLPVDNYLLILQLFTSENEETGLGSNEISRLTGRTDKQQVYQDIKALMKAKLLHSKKSRRVGYKEPKYLTGAGKKIKQFVDDMNHYKKSCAAFRNKVSTLLSCVDDDGKIKRFQDLVNVDDIDIDSKRKDYEKLVNYTSELAHPIAVINRIIFRYCKLLTEFDEKSVKIILNQIVTEAITSELQEMIHDSNEILHQKFANLDKNTGNSDTNQSELNMYKIQNIYHSASRDTYLDVLVSSWSTNTLDFQCLKEEFKEMAKMSLRILPPPSEEIAEVIEIARKVAVKRFDGKMNADHGQTTISIFEEGYRNG